MGSWQIVFDRPAEKSLKRMPANLRRRILAAAYRLAKDPYPATSTRLVGHEKLYRLRVGDWRIIYSVEYNRLIILVMDIGPRGSVYRKF